MPGPEEIKQKHKIYKRSRSCAPSWNNLSPKIKCWKWEWFIPCCLRPHRIFCLPILFIFRGCRKNKGNVLRARAGHQCKDKTRTHLVSLVGLFAKWRLSPLRTRRLSSSALLCWYVFDCILDNRAFKPWNGPTIGYIIFWKCANMTDLCIKKQTGICFLSHFYSSCSRRWISPQLMAWIRSVVQFRDIQAEISCFKFFI